MFRKRKDNNRGAITVEATIALTTFLFMFMMLYSIITICRAQAAVGSALNNTAKEISQYTYLYSLTGIHESIAEATDTTPMKDKLNGLTDSISTSFDAMQKMNDDATNISQTEITDMTGVLQDWGSVCDIVNNVQTVEQSTKELTDKIEELAKDPKSLLIGLSKIVVSDGISLAKSKIITPPICKVLMAKHLKSYDGQDVEEYLSKLHIVPVDGSYAKGLDYSNSSLFSSDEYDIVLHVEYEIQVVPYLPIEINMKFCQSAATRGWADGDGRHLKDDGSIVKGTIKKADEPTTNASANADANTETNTEQNTDNASSEETTASGEDGTTSSNDDEDASDDEEPPSNDEDDEDGGGVNVLTYGEIRKKMVDKYGEIAVKNTENFAKYINNVNYKEWDEQEFDSSILAFLNEEDSYENKYSRSKLASYMSRSEKVVATMKRMVENSIKNHPSYETYLLTLKDETNFLKLVNKSNSKYNDGDYSVCENNYSYLEEELINDVYEAVQPPTNTIMQKVFEKSSLLYYTPSNIETPVKVKGCVACVEDVLPYTKTYSEMRENLRMDYSGSQFKNQEKFEYFVTRYDNPSGVEYECPKSNKPNTRVGFLGNDNHLIPEFKCDETVVPKGAVYKVKSNGVEEYLGMIVDGHFFEATQYANK